MIVAEKRGLLIPRTTCLSLEEARRTIADARISPGLFGMSETDVKINFAAPAVLRKWPSLDHRASQRRSWRTSSLIGKVAPVP